MNYYKSKLNRSSPTPPQNFSDNNSGMSTKKEQLKKELNSLKAKQVVQSIILFIIVINCIGSTFGIVLVVPIITFGSRHLKKLRAEADLIKKQLDALGPQVIDYDTTYRVEPEHTASDIPYSREPVQNYQYSAPQEVKVERTVDAPPKPVTQTANRTTRKTQLSSEYSAFVDGSLSDGSGLIYGGL